ncbi:ATP-dependent helicase [Sinorhizobium meliloti]|uniref:ATP-dependent helicase n=1 Tax=Rhizobium meliloti TaxID=382 RepID=UPI00244E496A|nr:ATP-dependent helicase [Sinorhizobium meliloti]WGI73318.1 ATP-dependent helicase [Sinorhizobium meliloti]
MRAVKARANTLVTAGPGAGKTELLGQRGVFLMQTGLCPYPRRILAISFKRDAARNLRERFERRCSKEQIDRFDSLTFDAFTKQLFDRFWRGLPPQWALRNSYTVAFAPSRGEVQQFQRTVADGLGDETKLGGRVEKVASVKAERNGVMSASYDEYQGGIQRMSLVPPRVGTYGAFLHLARIAWALDQDPSPLTFQMLGRLLQAIVENNPVVRRAICATYSHVFIDEFQDTTYVQYELVRSIFKGSTSVITAVGDDKQRIMRWAGAQDDSFGEFAADFLDGPPELGRARLVLQSNYRSNKRIVEILNILKGRLAPTEPDFVAVRDAPDLPPEQICSVVVSENESEENANIATFVSGRILAGIDPRQIGLLVRQKANDWEDRLAPYFEASGVGLRNEDRNVGGASIQDLMVEPYAQAVVDSLEFLSTKRGGIAWTRLVDLLMTVEGLDEQAGDERKSRVLDPLDEFKSRNFFDEAAVPSAAQIDALVGNVEAFLGLPRLAALAPHYQQGSYFDQIRAATRAFLKEAANGKRNWKEVFRWYRGEGQVPLLTIAKSKGLEYSVVVQLGLDDTQWWSFAKDPTDGHSNFFVAASRARDRLHMAFCKVNKTQKINEIYDLLRQAQVPIQTGAEWAIQ